MPAAAILSKLLTAAVEASHADMQDNETEPKQALERSSKLPDEIIDAHQSRSDFLKWKLILVAALGAAALGLEETASPAPLLLALIPCICLYVDLVCSNLNLRLIVIGTFYARSRGESYERFAQQHRRVFDMEDWALYGSSYLICLIVLLIGLAFVIWPPQKSSAKANGPNQDPPGQAAAPAAPAASFWQRPVGQGWILMSAAAVGLGLSVFVQLNCRKRRKLPLNKLDATENRRQITSRLRPHYTPEEFRALEGFLAGKGCFAFRSLSNGLFPAAAVSPGDASGYQYVWVRDNVHVAHAHWACGDSPTAARTAATLMTYFQKQRGRFRNIIQSPAEKSNPMKRPHIRFDGATLAEIKQEWSHAQNDALGYFLWFYCKLARQGLIACGDPEWECLTEFLLYFQAIEYWQDRDSGHWEEARKVSASSIGTVLAGLREFERLAEERQHWSHPLLTRHALTSARVKHLYERGLAALENILPCESIEPEKEYRRYDGALLFLIYPLEILPRNHADTVLRDLRTHLQGDYGIRRYLGDSYWCPDFKVKFPPGKLTSDQSTNMSKRDAHAQFGAEAQWCIFDPIISVIYGQRYLAARKQDTGDQANEMLQLQTEYLNRSVSQLTNGGNGLPAYRSPEAYYIERGRYVPNDQTPLLWSQANLWLAIHQMRRSLELP